MDDLEISIVLRYRVPKKGLTFNGLVRGLDRDKDVLMRAVLEEILRALEEKAIMDYTSQAPDRYARHGSQPNHRKLMTSFGEIRHRLVQLQDKQRGTVFCPLVKELHITPYKQYQGEALEAAVGQAVHLSYRLGARETQRIKGFGPTKSTLWRSVQELARARGDWPPLKHRKFKFLMVDGTKVRLQRQGESLGKAELRWAWAAEEIRGDFELVGFWVDQDWGTIRRDLSQRLEYRRLRTLFSDGGPGIAENLLSGTMDHQRCLWHGKRDFFCLLFQDGYSKAAQEPLRELVEVNPLFSLKQGDLEQLTASDRPLVTRLVRAIKRCFRELLEVLPAERYPKSRTYIENFYRHSLLFFDYWLEGKGWIPMTTNIVESAFSRIVNRVKRVGRRWSEEGLINWLKIAFRKIFHPALWRKLWREYLRLNKSLTLTMLKVDYQWIDSPIT